MRMPSDYDAYCELMDDPDPYADERAEEERYWRSLELAHIEGMLASQCEIAIEILRHEGDAPGLLYALLAFANDVLLYAEAEQLRAAS